MKLRYLIEIIFLMIIFPVENVINIIHTNIYALKDMVTIGLLLLVCILIFIFALVPELKKMIIRKKIRLNMRHNNYLLQYQPIYNPRNNRIVGFEGLLRLQDKNKELISPLKFIPEIENNNMLNEVSLWIIEKVTEDYSKIYNYECMQKMEFYISLNLSLNEIENDYFVDRAISLLANSRLGEKKICLEIIERFKMNNYDKVNQNIKRLKAAGYKLAIDDFGVEYSNLDTLHNFNADIIKVDKFFVDGIVKDEFKEEVILFISKLAGLRNQSVVLEGVEEISQVAKIKEIENDYLFVQGFFYGEPMELEKIRFL